MQNNKKGNRRSRLPFSFVAGSFSSDPQPSEIFFPLRRDAVTFGRLLDRFVVRPSRQAAFGEVGERFVPPFGEGGGVEPRDLHPDVVFLLRDLCREMQDRGGEVPVKVVRHKEPDGGAARKGQGRPEPAFDMRERLGGTLREDRGAEDIGDRPVVGKRQKRVELRDRGGEITLPPDEDRVEQILFERFVRQFREERPRLVAPDLLCQPAELL